MARGTGVDIVAVPYNAQLFLGAACDGADATKVRILISIAIRVGPSRGGRTLPLERDDGTLSTSVDYYVSTVCTCLGWVVSVTSIFARPLLPSSEQVSFRPFVRLSSVGAFIPSYGAGGSIPLSFNMLLALVINSVAVTPMQSADSTFYSLTGVLLRAIAVEGAATPVGPTFFVREQLPGVWGSAPVDGEVGRGVPA